MTCTIPGADSKTRLAAGNFDSDGRTDLAVLKPSNPLPGVYWLRNQDGAMDFSVSPISSGSFPIGLGKLVVVRAPDGGRDALAAKTVTGTILGWAPVASGGYTLVLTDGGTGTDLSAARLPGWASEGLVTSRYKPSDSELVAYPQFHSGSDVSITTVKTASTDPWRLVTPWRNWLVMGTGSGAQPLSFYPDGGQDFVGSVLTHGSYDRAQEMDLTGDTSTEFFMHRSGTAYPHYSVYELGTGSLINPSPSKKVVLSDGGSVPLGTDFALGHLGSAAVNLVTLGDGGTLRRFGNFTPGTNWVVTELPSLDAGTDFVAVQAVIADMDGNGTNDLILVDSVGTLRILFWL